MKDGAEEFGRGGEWLEVSLREEWVTLLIWCLVLACLLGAAGVFRRITASRGTSLGVAFSTARWGRTSEMQALMTVRAFVAWHNLQEGNFPIRLEEVPYDDDPTQAVEELARRDVRAVVGFFHSFGAEAARRVASREQVPILASGASSSRFDREDDWLFRTRGSTEGDAEAYVALCHRAGVKNLVVLYYEENDLYRTSFVRDMVIRGGARILRTLPYRHVMGESFSPRSAGVLSPDGILVVGPSVPSVWMGQRARQVWPGATLLLSPWSLASLTAEEARLLGEGVLGAEGVLPGWADSRHPFVRFWRERFGDLPLGVVEHHTFLALRWFLDALGESGGGGEALRRSLAKPRELRGIGRDRRVDAFGDSQGDLLFLRLNRRGYFQVMNP